MSKLKLSDIRSTLPFRITKSTSVFVYLKDCLPGNKYGYTLDFDVFLPSKSKNLQRPFCWTLHQKQELILSVLKGIKIPDISVIVYTDDVKHKKVNSEKTYKIIDGKQRLSTLISYALGEFPITYEDKEYYLNDLDEEARREILLYGVIGNIAYEYPDDMISDENKIKWFELINFAGTAQDKAHLDSLKSKP